MTRAVSGLRNAFTFGCFDLLTSLGSNLSLRLFKRIVMIGLPLALLMVSLSILVAMRFVRTLVTGAPVGDGDGTAVLPALVTVMILLYLGASQFIGEVLTRRRVCISGNPNVGLFRAVDLRMLDIFLVVAGIRIALFHALQYALALTFVVTFADLLTQSPILLALVGLVPTVSMVASFQVAARNALRPKSDAKIGRLSLAGLILVGAGLGWTTSLVLRQTLKTDAMNFSYRSVETPAGIALAVLVSLALVGVFDLIRSLRRIGVASFLLETSTAPNAKAQHRAARSVRISNVVLFWLLQREFRGATAYALFDRSRALTFLVLAWAAAAHLHGDILPVSGIVASAGTSVLYLAFFLLALAHVDVILGTCGPTALRGQFRIAWENGVSAQRLVTQAQSSYHAPLAVLALCGLLLNAILFGQLAIGYVVLASAAVSAALIAESLTASPKNLADGSVAPNLFVGLMTILLSAPALAVVSIGNGAFAPYGLLYIFFLWGGAALCMTKRIKTSPLILST